MAARFPSRDPPYRDWSKAPGLGDAVWILQRGRVPAWTAMFALLALIMPVAFLALGTQPCVTTGPRAGGICGLSFLLAVTIAAGYLLTEALAGYVLLWALYPIGVAANSYGVHVRFARGHVAFAWEQVTVRASQKRKGHLVLRLQTADRFRLFPAFVDVPSAEAEPGLRRFGRWPSSDPGPS